MEYACHTGNMGLAKLCYRRGANLSAKTQKGETAFNIVTQNKRYDLMEFLHTYGVKAGGRSRVLSTCDLVSVHSSVSNCNRKSQWSNLSFRRVSFPAGTTAT